METIIIGAMVIEAKTILMVIITMGMRLITLDMLHAQLKQVARDLFYPPSHPEIQFS